MEKLKVIARWKLIARYVLFIVLAVGWGLFISLMPIMEVLFFLFPIWFCVFVFIEWRLVKKFGFWPGGAYRLAIISSIVVFAMYYPAKFEDQMVEPLPGYGDEVSLEELPQFLRAQAISAGRANAPEGLRKEIMVPLPDEPMRLKKYTQYIEAQTDLQSRTGYCGNGVTLFYGGYPIGGLRWDVPQEMIDDYYKREIEEEREAARKAREKRKASKKGAWLDLFTSPSLKDED